MLPWWSFTKTTIAAAALALVRDGKLDLDQPFDAEPFTLRHLLQHSSGLRDYGALPEYQRAVAAGEPPWSESELLARSRSDALLFEPGDGFSYSNIGYLLVNRCIARASQRPAAEAVHALVLEPLGIRGVHWANTAEQMAACAWQTARPYHPGWVYHGLLLGTPSSAALLLRRLLSGDLLPSGLRAAMLDGRPLDRRLAGDRPLTSIAYGLGLMLPTGAQGRMQGHSGGGPGSGCAVFHFPDLTPARTVSVFASVEDAAVIERRMLELAAVPAAERPDSQRASF